jgi:hypothetical protein
MTGDLGLLALVVWVLLLRSERKEGLCDEDGPKRWTGSDVVD